MSSTTVVIETSSVEMNSDPGADSRWAAVIGRIEDENEFAETFKIAVDIVSPTAVGTTIQFPSRAARRER
jgi:hypothetical protein